MNPSERLTIFEFANYRAYFDQVLKATGKRSGMKSRAAAAMGSQPAFLSRVLAGQADLSLEQADKISRFLEHGTDEHHFFLLLVQHDRSGSASLRTYFRRLLDAEKQKRVSVTDQIKPADFLQPAAQSRYYSSWVYGAVHVLLSIDRLQTATALAKVLHLPSTLIGEVLDFLVAHGLARTDKGRFFTGPIHVHLRQDSDHILRHHANWRKKSLEALSRPIRDEVRYSGVLTLDSACAAKLRESLIQNLKANLGLVEKAPAETAYVFNIDFFRLID